MTARADAAAYVIAPYASNVADPTHQAGLIFRVANSTAFGPATAADIPKACRGRYWRLLTIGADVQWAVLLDADGISGVDTTPTLIYNTPSITGTGVAGAAQTLLDRTPEHYYISTRARRLIFVSSAGTGFFEASISGERTGA
jgi:hypothetical protein